MFVYITSENKQRQQLLQRLLGIFPRPNFFTGKTNCRSYPMSFHDKDVNRDRNFKLILPSTFSMACMKTVGLRISYSYKLQRILELPQKGN